MNVGIETFDPVGDELHGTPQQLRQRVRRHLVGIDMDLDAERAADILAHHANLRIVQPKMQRCDVLHHVRRLGSLIDRQPSLGGIPVGHHRARLQRHAGVAAEDELRFHHGIGGGECRIDRADIEVALEGEVVAERGIDDGGCRIKRGAHVRDRLQLEVFHPDLFGGVFRQSAALGHNGGHGFALPADAVDRNGVLWRGFQSLQMREHTHPGCDDLGELFARDDSEATGARLDGTAALFVVDGKGAAKP